MSGWVCGWCLEEVESEERPLVCKSCRMGNCIKCSTRCKVGAVICHGCGTFTPVIEARMLKSSSTAIVYATKEWKEAGRARHLCEEDRYGICTGYLPHDHSRIGTWIYRGVFGSDTLIRELTEKEMSILRQPIGETTNVDQNK